MPKNMYLNNFFVKYKWENGTSFIPLYRIYLFVGLQEILQRARAPTNN